MQSLVDKQFNDTKSSRSDVFRVHSVVLLRCGSFGQSQTKNVGGLTSNERVREAWSANAQRVYATLFVVRRNQQ